MSSIGLYIKSSFALEVTQALPSVVVVPGLISKYVASKPAICGLAILVPDMFAVLNAVF